MAWVESILFWAACVDLTRQKDLKTKHCWQPDWRRECELTGKKVCALYLTCVIRLFLSLFIALFYAAFMRKESTYSSPLSQFCKINNTFCCNRLILMDRECLGESERITRIMLNITIFDTSTVSNRVSVRKTKVKMEFDEISRRLH